MMAGARGSLPVVSKAVDTSQAAKAEQARSLGEGSYLGLEGLRGETGLVLKIWGKKNSLS